MTTKKSAGIVREPVQVYLTEGDRAALDRVAAVTGLPRTEVLRRGLRRFAAEVLVDESPVLAFLQDASADPPITALNNVAEDHDQFLAEWEVASWANAAPTVKPKRARK